MSEPTKLDLFRERLNQHPGGPWYLNGSHYEPDDQIVQLSDIDLQRPWCHPTSFLDFLDVTSHRRLLWTFIGGNPLEKERRWSFDRLLQETHAASPEALEKALDFCSFQQFTVPESTKASTEVIYQFMHQMQHGDTSFSFSPKQQQDLAALPEKSRNWWCGQNLYSIRNSGPSFEWVTQTLLEQKYSALARRNVQLSRFQSDIDVLAFFPDHQSLVIECKSSTKNITDSHICRFFQKAQIFQPDVALLLIDADDPLQMQQRIPQLYRTSYTVYGEFPRGNLHTLAGSSLIRVQERVYVADTGKRLTTTLQFILDYQRYGLS